MRGFPRPGLRLLSVPLPAWRTSAALIAVSGAFGAGVVVASTPTGRTTERQGALDKAADQIAAHSFRQVDRQQLDRAAIDGMLDATGDKWATDLGMGPVPARPRGVADVRAALLAPGVVQLRIARFDPGVGVLVHRAVQSFRAARIRAIVLDLRADPGGLL